MRLHAEVPLVALLHLVHLRVALLVLVFGRRRRMQDGRVHDGAGADLQPMPGQIAIDRSQHLLAEPVALEQMAELAHGGLIRRRLATQVDAHERAHGERVVERVFNGWIGQVEPLLEKVNPQHPFQPDRRTAVAGLRIMWLDQRHQLRPRHHTLHLREELRTPRLPSETLKPCRQRQRLLLHQQHLKHTII